MVCNNREESELYKAILWKKYFRSNIKAVTI